MADKFAGYFDNISDPGTRSAAIVPSDTADLPDVGPKGIYVGARGDVTMVGVGAPIGAAPDTWKDVAAGSLIPFRARRVMATGTTAANLLAIY